MCEDLALDWSRVAEPQLDSYDLFAFSGALAKRRCSSSNHSHFFEGAVCAIDLTDELACRTGFVSAPLYHLPMAIELLRCWPVVHKAFPVLVDTIVPVAIPGLDTRSSTGSSSTHLQSYPRTVFVTTFDAIGTATALVHEMAHLKLHSIGIHIEESASLILNDASELFESPVRKDKGRPMQAILHAAYAFAHIADLLIHIMGGDAYISVDTPHAMMLYRSLSKLEPAIAVLRTHVRTDRRGSDLLAGFLNWGDRVMVDGQEVLNRHTNAWPRGSSERN